MKTPMQELIDEAIKYSRKLSTEGYFNESLAADHIIDLAESLLEKEKEVMCEFAEEYVGSCLIDYPKIKIIFDQTFNN
jgi:hypothetical protein